MSDENLDELIALAKIQTQEAVNVLAEMSSINKEFTKKANSSSDAITSLIPQRSILSESVYRRQIVKVVEGFADEMFVYASDLEKHLPKFIDSFRKPINTLTALNTVALSGVTAKIAASNLSLLMNPLVGEIASVSGKFAGIKPACQTIPDLSPKITEAKEAVGKASDRLVEAFNSAIELIRQAQKIIADFVQFN